MCPTLPQVSHAPLPVLTPAAAKPARWLDPILVQVFTLTFLAEWGDRSQVATIGLAASANVAGVTAGGCLGHALCTGAAVLGIAEHGVDAGKEANFFTIPAETMAEAIGMHPARNLVFFRGRLVARNGEVI